jgi:hypothetical protein
MVQAKTIQDLNMAQTWKLRYMCSPTIKVFSFFNQNDENVSYNPYNNKLPSNPKWIAN